MTPVKLPIGIQDFEKIISDSYTYIDKTKLIYRMISEGTYYFLSRPRRFGKSLLVSTLATIFAGKRSFFEGLWIDNSDWDWQPYPIIRLDMSAVNNESSDMLERSLSRTLHTIAANHQLTLSGETSSDYLTDLITQLAVQQRVVVLIDEYDKPLIDQLDYLHVVKANRDILRRFYSVLKTLDHYLKFVFLTGVSKFSKVSVFSGLNNLNDLTMSNDYSALLGFTKQELEQNFAADIQSLAHTNSMPLEECYDKIKQWYNGYKFSKYGELVYNPFSTLKLLHSKDFGAYWFETGTPTFLIKLIQKREFDLLELDQIEISADAFSSFEIEELPVIPILYQTGYLTIQHYDSATDSYSLGYPNREVGINFSKRLINYFANSNIKAEGYINQLHRNMSALTWDHAQFFSIISELLALIPYDLYLKQEKHYQSLFYLIIKLAGISVNAEVNTQRGRVDAVIDMKDKIIIFEFKLDQSAQVAIEQIKNQKYYQFFFDRNVPIYLVGVNFNSHLRTMDDYTVEQLEKAVCLI